MGEPHLVQKRRCIASPLWPPGIVKVDMVPVIETASDGTAKPDTKAVPVCFWQSTQLQSSCRIGFASIEYRTAPHKQPPV
jgi:hypothetical protein